MSEIILSVTGMTCGGCVNSVQQGSDRPAGRAKRRGHPHARPGARGVDPARVDRAALVQAVVDAGFGVAD
jgi:copper chaperone